MIKVHKVYKSIRELIGRTPLLALNQIKEHFNLKGNIYAKLENLNPGGSIKDRVAYRMLEQAELMHVISKTTTIVEASSGNTGIGLAMVCASLGYKLIIVMPDSASLERRYLLRAYGAKVITTPAAEGMAGALKRAEELLEETSRSYMPNQFTNRANPYAHYAATAHEIYQALDGKIDFFVCGVGSGGTISGAGEYFKDRNLDVKMIGIEPKASPFITEGWAGEHLIQGIGAGFLPPNFNQEVVDEMLTVSNEDAFEYTRLLARKEGLLVGISSGAALVGAVEIARKNPDKNVVVVFPDLGDRYLSTGIFNNPL